jgi:sugar lactone lactonase YvrE
MVDIRVVAAAITQLGENPIWDVTTERLYWIDVFGQTVFRSTADGHELSVWQPGPVNAMALRARGGVLAVAGPRLYVYDLDTADSETVFESDVAMNDGKVDRQGRFVTGGVAPGMSDPTSFTGAGDDPPRAGLFRLDADLSVHTFGDGVSASNGPTFSPDGRTLYWSDSGTRQVYAWDYDTADGIATDRRLHADFAADTTPGAVAIPDGATVDAEGYRWVAAFFGREVRRYRPDGTLDRRLPLPVHSPTSVTFGGPNLDVLFVTSMAVEQFPGNPHKSGPLDGSVLAVHGLGVTGLPERRFAG